MTAHLEDLVAGAAVRGLKAGEAVTLVAVDAHGEDCRLVVYRTSGGQVAQQLVYRDAEKDLDIEAQVATWTFDGDGALFRLVAEARRIRLAYLFDPLLAVHLSLLRPLPHQIQAVYGTMLPRHPLRFALCDDPGAGKTIMAGLYIKELILRGDVKRCLVVAPGGLVGQWQDELADRFGLGFRIVTRDMIEATQSADPFIEYDFLIARLDHLSRNSDLVALVAANQWDLVIVDEAHRMSAHHFGNEVKKTQRYRLGEVLSTSARHFMLLTATPHSGKEDDFQLFMALLDPDRFEGKPRGRARSVDASDLMRRVMKENLYDMEGNHLFPPREAHSVPYSLSDREMALYAEVTDYVANEMNRADMLASEGEGRRGNRVGFAVTVLQRRVASSPEAIFQSLCRRRKRLEDRLAEVEKARAGRMKPSDPVAEIADEEGTALDGGSADLDWEDVEDLDDAEREDLETEMVDQASSARTVAELAAEIDTLKRLELLADQVRRAGTDRKWTELVDLLQDLSRRTDSAGRPEKLIVFTEHKDTLEYLKSRLAGFFGRTDAVVDIHGGVNRLARRQRQETFTNDPRALVLIATDAAGEGINLQRARFVVNYDLPWNPNRLEQRFGRVHRIGQEERCEMWNMVAVGTREGDVYRRLLDKLAEQNANNAMNGTVFDVLGKALPGRSLRDLLVRAVREGNRPEIRAELEADIDEMIGPRMTSLLREHALASDVLAPSDVEQIRRTMAEAAARRLQPHYVRSWFANAFESLGGRMSREREKGRYEITRVPESIRQSRGTMVRAPVVDRYERVTFDTESVKLEGSIDATLIAPGHPLLEGVVDRITERYGDLLRRGAVLIDSRDEGSEPRAVFMIEHAIADGTEVGNGSPRVVSRRFEFVSVDASGSAHEAGHAPYLDWDPPTADERAAVLSRIPASLAGDAGERAAADHAIRVAVPAHMAAVRTRTDERIAKVRAAVKERLTREIAYWAQRAAELDAQVAAGKQPRLNPDRARSTAEDLSRRLEHRLADLEAEQQLTALPPVVVGGVLVAPRAMVEGGAPAEPAIPVWSQLRRREVEDRAIEAVRAAEIALGRYPEVMVRNNPGFDIKSLGPGAQLTLVEVKGRVEGAPSFSVTRNEMLYALNAPDSWVLAMVEVSPDGPADDRVRYVRRPFGDEINLPFATTAATLEWSDYWNRGSDPS